MMSIAQARGARGLLGWSQTALAKAAGLSLPTVKRYETGTGAKVSQDAAEKLQRALEKAGVEFIAENGGGPGVRLRKAPADAAESPQTTETSVEIRKQAEAAVDKALSRVDVPGEEKVRRKKLLTRVPKSILPD